MDTFFSDIFDFVYNHDIRDYCQDPPFDPPESYPELPFISNTNNKKNRVYAMVRELFMKLRMDEQHIRTSKWNPLQHIVNPGDRVLIKPNLVNHEHYLGDGATLSTIVHGSVLRPVIDYVYLALQGDGCITIADNPVEPADFERLMEISGIREMVSILNSRGYKNLRLIDLRPMLAGERHNGNLELKKAPGDPLGYATIDLGENSCFYEFDKYPDMHYYTLEDPTVDHLEPSFVGKSITDEYHNARTHKYIVSKTVLDADVIIDVAKLKTHCKAGVTLTLKNLIGIVSTKACLPHHRPGPPPMGDSFPEYPPAYYSSSRKLYRFLRTMVHIHKLPGVRSTIDTMRKKQIMVGQHIEHGNWKGNDTVWRTTLDIARIAFYADRRGTMQETLQRKFFGFIDGIIGQHGNAPISGEPISCGVVLAGYNPVCLDAFATQLMGFDYNLIPTIVEAQKIAKWPLIPSKVEALFGHREVPNLGFMLPKGWR